MTLSRADLEAIRAIVRDEVARATNSGRPSPIGIGARDQGDLECDEKERNESMDPTTEEAERSVGESSSPELMAARLLNRSRQRQKLRRLPTLLERKPKAAR